MNKDKFVEYLENEIRLYKELGEYFADRKLELEQIYEKVIRGEFD